MTATDGLQALLGAEHAAIYGYGIAGAALVRAQAPSTFLAAVRGGFDAHRQTRDQLADSVAAAGANPVAALAAYQLPFAVTDTTSALRLLALLEDRVAAVAAYAVATSSGAGRRLAADDLSASAVRVARLRLLTGTPAAGVAVAFPGLSAG